MPDAPSLDPARTALLVMDFQPAILDRLPDAGAAPLARARDALDAVRAHGGLVGFVRVAFTDADLAAMPETSAMRAAVGAGRALPADAPETAVHGDLAPQDGETVVRKVRVGAFSTTDLDTQLRARGVDTLVLAGISTSGVVLSTVRDAADRDYRLLVLRDACADPRADVHAFLLEHVLPRQAEVLATAGLAERLAGRH